MRVKETTLTVAVAGWLPGSVATLIFAPGEQAGFTTALMVQVRGGSQAAMVPMFQLTVEPPEAPQELLT